MLGQGFVCLLVCSFFGFFDFYLFIFFGWVWIFINQATRVAHSISEENML